TCVSDIVFVLPWCQCVCLYYVICCGRCGLLNSLCHLLSAQRSIRRGPLLGFWSLIFLGFINLYFVHAYGGRRLFCYSRMDRHRLDSLFPLDMGRRDEQRYACQPVYAWLVADIPGFGYCKLDGISRLYVRRRVYRLGYSCSCRMIVGA